MLFTLVGTTFADVFAMIMSHETEPDSSDAFYQAIYTTLQNHEFTVTYFVASYLLFWGTIDVVLSIFLLRHRLWAFPISIVLMGLFVLYETYRVFHTHSLILITIILIDIGIIYLIYREYLILTGKLVKRSNSLTT